MKIRIGLETHVQLKSASKLFCGCMNMINLQKEAEPNTLTCPTCLGLPGSKPRLNEAILKAAIKAALALNCKISEEIFFSRKTYFYPDMSKNFQITQYEAPLALKGYIQINVKNKKKKIFIRRVQIEEDPAKLSHIKDLEKSWVFVDYNRAGVPLIEIVTEPDFESIEEVRQYLQKLTMILEYLDLYESYSSAVIKSDVNVSIDKNERVEIKNITGVKEIEKALNYEIVRQEHLARLKIKIKRETLMWDTESKSTKPLREKETEADYGYIFEPDLTQISLQNTAVIKKEIPELPDVQLKRIMNKYKISEKLAESIVSERELVQLFENILKSVKPKIAASWIAGPLKKTLNWNQLVWKNTKLEAKWIIELLKLFEKEKFSDYTTEMILRKMVEERRNAPFIIKKYKFEKIEGEEIELTIKKILEKNKQAIVDYKNGKEKALHFLIGQCVRESKGKISAEEAKKIILGALVAQ